MSSKTMVVKQGEIKRDWYVVDAGGKALGRVASRVAMLLMGKNKPAYSPSLDTGDFVVVVNAQKAVLTGKKEKGKIYRRHTGFPGGLRETPAAEMRVKHPEKLIEEAVKGMLPKNTLGRKQFKKLKVYGGPTHPHEAQRPRTLELAGRG
jgi:large subunit ribosomal protein L13